MTLIQAEITGCREATVRQWGWRFVFDADGGCVGGVELCSRFADDGAELAQWAIDAPVGTVREFVADGDEHDPIELARGDYQRDILEGRAGWSGSDLVGRARQYGGRYAQSRRNLAERLATAGFDVEVRDVPSEINGRRMRVLFVDGVARSATS